MKLSIDPVETFFSGITGLWGRALALFGTCWASFAFGILCGTVTWGPGDGLPSPSDLYDIVRGWYALPIGWMFSLPAAVLMRWWWGLPHGLIVIGVFYAVMFLEADLFRSVLILFVAESFHGFLIVNPDLVEVMDLFSWIAPPWHVFLPFMLLMDAYAVWHVYVTWRNERREEMPP